MELINESKNEFVDISSEEYRIYHFPLTEGGPVRIDNPLYLSAGKNGHRLLDAEGISHYIPSGWKHLSWKSKQGKPHFVK